MIDIRTEIDRIDNSIVQLISHRSEYVKEASKFKKDIKAVKDTNRVAKVIASKTELALRYDAPSELIEIIYTLMIDYFVNAELNEWKSNQA